jgi:NAD-dependent SIR2 family protein deacetylase
MMVPDEFQHIAGETKHLAQRFQENRLIVWVGAGLSVGANLPSWQELTDVLKDELDLKQTSDPLRVSQLYEKRLGRSALERTIVRQLNKPHVRPTSAHHALAELYAARRDGYLITTNYDQLLETTFKEHGLPTQVFRYLSTTRT